MSDDVDVDVVEVPRLRLVWSPWVEWDRLWLDARSGGARMPDRPGIYEVRYADGEERLTIGKAANLRMRVKQALVKGKSPHSAGGRIRATEDTAQLVVRWALTERPAAVEEELHLRHVARFGRLPKYTFFT